MKYLNYNLPKEPKHVAPARERGLKFGSAAGAFAGGVVAPARERGLKYKLSEIDR